MTTRKRTKNRQYNEGQEYNDHKTDNTMTTRKLGQKDRQYNDHKKKDEGQTIQ